MYCRTDAQGLPVIEQLKKDNLTAYVEHDPVTGEPLILRTNTGMQSLWVYDGTGNPAALLTSGEYVAFAYNYDPYGKPTLTENSGGLGVPLNPYTFKIDLQDRATGWVKYGQRWYNAGTGCWTHSLDAPLDPANANRYAYAANDPINNADPLGLNCTSDLIGLAGGLAFATAFAALAVANAVPTAGLGTASSVVTSAGFFTGAIQAGVSAGDSCDCK